jgi:gamma-glutamyltranspeptidase/glutathione hydrolase
VIAPALNYAREGFIITQFNGFSLHLLEPILQIMELTNQARQNKYDHNIHTEGITETFLGEENICNYVNKLGSTIHISVLDGEGNAASLTSTNGEGSSYFIPELGIMLNNMLGEADLNPHGFHNWCCNQRLSSMMASTLIL